MTAEQNGRLSRGVTMGQLIGAIAGVALPFFGWTLVDRLALERRLTQLESFVARAPVVREEQVERDRRIKELEREVHELQRK